MENMLCDLAIWKKRGRGFGEIVFGDFGENMFGDLEKSCSAILEKTCSAIWRNVVGVVMAITYWSSLWSSMELGDRKWMLNHNRDKTETSYGDQNFTEYKIGEYISGVFQG